MMTNRGRVLNHRMSRQTFLRGAIGALRTGVVFSIARKVVDPVVRWGPLASAIGSSIPLPASGAAFTIGKQFFNSF